MKKIAIGIDNWKLPIFERLLKEGGYEYKKHKFTATTTILKVKAQYASDIQKLCEKGQQEAAQAKQEKANG